jgi:hypothetical protein
VTAVRTLTIFIAGVRDLAGVGPTDWRDGSRRRSRHRALGRRLGLRPTADPFYRAGRYALIGPAVGLVGALAVTQNLWELGMILVGVGIVSFLAGWFTLGVAAIRLDRSPAPKPA